MKRERENKNNIINYIEEFTSRSSEKTHKIPKTLIFNNYMESFFLCFFCSLSLRKQNKKFENKQKKNIKLFACKLALKMKKKINIIRKGSSIKQYIL
jgi:hypothetical protein